VQVADVAATGVFNTFSNISIDHNICQDVQRKIGKFEHQKKIAADSALLDAVSKASKVDDAIALGALHLAGSPSAQKSYSASNYSEFITSKTGFDISETDIRDRVRWNARKRSQLVKSTSHSSQQAKRRRQQQADASVAPRILHPRLATPKQSVSFALPPVAADDDESARATISYCGNRPSSGACNGIDRASSLP
jgi:hypothetical protein